MSGTGIPRPTLDRRIHVAGEVHIVRLGESTDYPDMLLLHLRHYRQNGETGGSDTFHYLTPQTLTQLLHSLGQGIETLLRQTGDHPAQQPTPPVQTTPTPPQDSPAFPNYRTYAATLEYYLNHLPALYGLSYLEIHRNPELRRQWQRLVEIKSEAAVTFDPDISSSFLLQLGIFSGTVIRVLPHPPRYALQRAFNRYLDWMGPLAGRHLDTAQRYEVPDEP